MTLAQIKRTMRRQLNQSKTSSPTPLQAGDESSAFSFMFNDAAKAVFANKANGLVHQYSEPNRPEHSLYHLFELAALLGIKSADENPCETMFTRRFALVRFFGFTCHPNDLDKARNKLIAIINDMSTSKWVIASLYNLGTLEFASDPLTPTTKKIAVFSYLAVDSNFDEAVSATYNFAEFKEGGTPPELT